MNQEAWFDAQTELPREEYDSYDYQLTDTEEYRIFLPHRAPILTQNSKMSSLVRARSLLSKLNTRLARGLASEPPWLTSSKLKGQKSCGQQKVKQKQSKSKSKASQHADMVLTFQL